MSWVSICLYAWVTQLWCWRPAKLAYCLALFPFRAMGALEQRDCSLGEVEWEQASVANQGASLGTIVLGVICEATQRRLRESSACLCLPPPGSPVLGPLPGPPTALHTHPHRRHDAARAFRGHLASSAGARRVGHTSYRWPYLQNFLSHRKHILSFVFIPQTLSLHTKVSARSGHRRPSSQSYIGPRS